MFFFTKPSATGTLFIQTSILLSAWRCVLLRVLVKICKTAVKPLILCNVTCRSAETCPILYFAGAAAMTSGFEFYGYRAMPYELRHDRLLHNFLGRKGFVLASTVTYRLAPISIVMMAPVCSTWVFLSRSKTLRSHAYPLGFPGHPPSPAHLAPWIGFGVCPTVPPPSLSTARGDLDMSV